MSNTDQQPDLSKGKERVPDTGSHEDFGQNAGTNAPGGEKGKIHKEETGATEAGNEDKGAKM